MKKEIKINNSKFKLVQYEEYERGKTEIILRNKKSLRYQFILLTGKLSNSGNPWLDMNTYGITKVKTYPNYSLAWGLEKSKELYVDEEYTTDEFMIILSFIAATVRRENLDVAETLVQATKDKELIHDFYEMYGNESINKYIYKINDIIRSGKYTVVESKDIYPKIYSSYNKYSISKLISELVEDKAEILINPELIGDYKKISIRMINKDSVTYKTDDWAKITGIMGNKTRANLSICYDSKVLITIPENTIGIEPGEKLFKTKQSICLVKDGLLNQSLIGVKISSKLAGKLKRLKLIKSELIYPGEYLVDISPLPIVTRCNIHEISSYYLSRLEVKYKLAVIANEYIQEYYPEAEIKLSPKEEFLKNLGISGEYYFPKKEKSKESVISYKTRELVSTVSGLPIDKKKRNQKYTYYRNNCLPDKDPIKCFLDSIGFDKRPIDEIRKEWKTNLMKYNNELRERKFQIIMSKTTRFNDQGTPLIEKTEKIVEITPEIKASVKWTFNIITKNI